MYISLYVGMSYKIFSLYELHSIDRPATNPRVMELTQLLPGYLGRDARNSNGPGVMRVLEGEGSTGHFETKSERQLHEYRDQSQQVGI